MSYSGAIDQYILGLEDFAQPIMNHIRELVHQACPETEEKTKWGFPHFDYKGPMCHMAGFKQHAIFGFWKVDLMEDPHKVFALGKKSMGDFGRLTSLDDLPSDDILIEYIHQAMDLNDRGIKLPKRDFKKREPLDIPDYFTAALERDKGALNTFQNFSYSHQKEYVEWVTEAKTEATRLRRLDQAIDWMAEGKPRNWKYMKKW